MSSISEDSFDDSSVQSNDKNSNNEVRNPAADENHPPINLMPGSSPQSQMALARLGTSTARLLNLEPHQHSTLFYLSLIEARCRTQAANAINARRSSEDKVAENHPDVHSLAQHLFGEMSNELHKAGILPNEFVGQELSEIRQNYLSSFDAILHNIASKRTQDIPDQGPYSSLDRSNVLAISRDLSTDVFSISRAIDFPNRFTMARGQKSLPEGQSDLISLVSGNSKSQPVSRSVYDTEYIELSLLGKGGFGHVYKTLNILDNREYAVKKIVISAERLTMIAGKDKVKGLLSELRTLANLDHKNVVRYYHGWIESRPTSLRKTGDGQDDASSSESESESENLASKMESVQVGLDRELKKDMKRVRRESMVVDESNSHLIVFENSSSSAKQADASQLQDRSSRQPNISQKALVGVRKSSFFYTTNDSNDSRDSTEDIFRSDAGGHSSAGAVDMILCIKMSLHPMTLEDYLWPDQQKSDCKISIQHCYHTFSSARILVALLDGVEYIHDQHLVHRDLKPSNIFLSIREGSASSAEGSGSINVSTCCQCSSNLENKHTFITPHIGDFGLVAEIKEAQPESPSTSNMEEKFAPTALAVLSSRQPGTKFYCPPKVSTSDTAICPKLDVYSLGVIAFELVTKFGTKSERNVVLDKLSRDVFPDGFDRHEMAAGIRSMLCKERASRWDCSSVRKWLKDLTEKTGE